MAFKSELLRAKLKEVGKNRRFLAELTDVKERTVSRWLNDKNPPKSSDLEKIAKALGCTPQDFDPSFADEGQGEVAIHARVSVASHNAYEIMRLRYGATQKNIMELAPVLFSIVAGHALRVPGEDEAQAARLGLIDSRQGSPEAQDAWGIDDRASRNKKCFGLNGEYSRNLFYEAIKRLCHDIDKDVCAKCLVNPGPEEAVSAIGFVPDIDALNEITGGDEELIEALTKGRIRLSTCIEDHKSGENRTVESFVSMLRRELARTDRQYEKDIAENREAGLMKLRAWRVYYEERHPDLAKEYDQIVEKCCHEDGWYPSYYDESFKEICWIEPYREDRHINKDNLPEYQAKKTEFPKALHLPTTDPIYRRFQQLEAHRQKAKAQFEEDGQ